MGRYHSDSTWKCSQLPMEEDTESPVRVRGWGGRCCRLERVKIIDNKGEIS